MVVDLRAEYALVQILAQAMVELGAMDQVVRADLATQIIVQVRVCNQR